MKKKRETAMFFIFKGKVYQDNDASSLKVDVGEAINNIKSCIDASFGQQYNNEVEKNLKELGVNAGDMSLTNYVDGLGDFDFVAYVDYMSQVMENIQNRINSLSEIEDPMEKVSALSQVEGVFASDGLKKLCDKMEKRHEKIDYKDLLRQYANQISINDEKF